MDDGHPFPHKLSAYYAREYDLVNDLGETLVEELTRNDRKTLVIDREQFREFSDELQATIATDAPQQEVAE